MRIDRFTCEETFRRLDDYLDRELSPREMRWVQEHLEVCAFCAAEFAFEAEVLERVRSAVSRVEAPGDLAERIRRSLARAARRSSPAQRATRQSGGSPPPAAAAAGRDASGTRDPAHASRRESAESEPREGRRSPRGNRPRTKRPHKRR